MNPAFSPLVSTEELAQHPDWRVFDCRHDLADPSAGERQYSESHLPGALFAHLDRDLSAPKTGRNGRHALPEVGSSRVDLQACKLEYSIVSPK